MNATKLNIQKGTKLTDGTHIFCFWGKIENSNKKMRYYLFDEHDKCCELSINEMLNLKPYEQ